MTSSRVLLVDDNPDFLTALADYLQEVAVWADLVGLHESAQDALEHWREVEPQILIADVNMPGMTGLELTRRVKQENGKVAVVLITLLDDPQAARVAFDSGADAFVSKRNLHRDLLPALQRLRTMAG